MSEDELLELSSIEVHGGLEKAFEHESRVTNSRMTFAVYLPPLALSNDDAIKLPLLMYLSGAGSTYQEFLDQSNYAEFAAKHSIVVCAPDTSPRDLGENKGRLLCTVTRDSLYRYRRRRRR